MSPSHGNVRQLSAETTPLSLPEILHRLPALSETSEAILPAQAPLESSFSEGWAKKQSRQIGTSRASQPASVGRSDLSEAIMPWMEG